LCRCQLFGGESILLMSTALVLISTLPHVERIFGGIDYAAIWHRRLVIAGTVLRASGVRAANVHREYFHWR
jgi:predicted ferric reductase